jgi:hypothetical protein
MGGVGIPLGARDFSFLHKVYNGSVAHPASYSMGTWGLKLAELEADDSPPSNYEVKNRGAIPPLSSFIFVI